LVITHTHVLEVLEGYRAVKVDAVSGWAIGWGGGTSFAAIRVADPRAGEVVDTWIREEDGQEGRLSLHGVIRELREALKTRKQLHFALYPNDLPPEEEC
jgi:hypothetical protein